MIWISFLQNNFVIEKKNLLESFINFFQGIDHFEDVGPCVVLASPGMMQSGLSRELFELWCNDSKNGCIVAGYCVEGTLAKHILSEPEEITTMNGTKLPLKMQVSYISFSAHTDYRQTSGFIRELKPPHVVLVHGEVNEMNRLKLALIREYEAESETKIKFYNPRNTVAVELNFRGEKMAKVMGSLAMEKPETGNKVSGILVKRNFNYHIVSASDLPKYSDLTMSTVTQRQSVYFSGTFDFLRFMVAQVSGEVEVVEENRVLRAFKAVDIVIEKRMVTLEWVASPVNDMYADAVLCAVLQAESMDMPSYIPASAASMKIDKMHFKECLIEMLQDMFGEDSVPRTFSGDEFEVRVDSRTAKIELTEMKVTCAEDSMFEQIVQTALTKLHHSLVPPGEKW